MQPWQREFLAKRVSLGWTDLAKRSLRFDTDPAEMRFRQHMFGAREGSDLGYGTPGGGCGCD